MTLCMAQQYFLNPGKLGNGTVVKRVASIRDATRATPYNHRDPPCASFLTFSAKPYALCGRINCDHSSRCLGSLGAWDPCCCLLVWGRDSGPEIASSSTPSAKTSCSSGRDALP